MSAKSRSTLASELTTAVNDNTSGDITPADVRGVITDANDSAVNKTDETTALSQSLLTQSTAAGMQSVVECPPTSRTISAGTGLTGGGDLSANRSFAVTYGTTSGTACQGNDSRLSDSRAPTGSAGGDLSGTYPNPSVATDAVTNAKLANMTASTIKARKTASTGDPEDCTLSEVLDLIGSAAQGDILYRGASGWSRLPAGTAGDVLETQGAGANPTWATPTTSGSDTVTLFQHNSITTSPADSVTLYCSAGNLRSTYADAAIKIPISGTVTKYWVRVAFNGTLGSTEDVNYYLRLNDITDFGNMVDDWDAYSEVTSSTLSQAVTAGDSIALKIVTPAWVTNPTNVYIHFWILIEA